MTNSAISISYILKERTIDSKKDYRDIYIIDEILYGDLKFTVDDKDFGVSNTFVLGISTGLIYGLEACLFFDEMGWTSYPEYDLKIATSCTDGKIRLELSDSSGLIESAECRALEICKAVGKFHEELLIESFRLHPELEDNEYFLQNCPAASHFAKKAGFGRRSN